MLDKRLDIKESQGTVVNMTFNTTVLTDGGGGEERNINWQSPLLSYDLQKLLLRRNQLDEIITFFQEVRGAATAFRYRDWSDYLVTAQPCITKYGSTTQGVLFPPADGIRTEFGLVKRYIIPRCTHYRAIALPDIDTVTIYDSSYNAFPDSDWIFTDGKFVFSTPPNTGQLFVEAEFDVPVVFATDDYQFKVVSAKSGDGYRIENLKLNEIRIEPYALLNDEGEEIDQPFALCGHFNSIVGINEQTEIITLSSGFDKRTSRFSVPKKSFNLGKIPLYDDELEYLIAFYRCCKGKGLRWGFYDSRDTELKDKIPVRFDEDNLAIRLNKQGRYEIDGIKIKEVFEPFSIFVTPPFSIAFTPVFVNPEDPTDPYTSGSQSSGGGGSGSGRGSFSISSFGASLQSAAPPLASTSRKYIGVALFWEGDTLHWLIVGDNTNTGNNYARNRLFYYRLTIENEQWNMTLQDHEISEIINPKNIKIIKTPGGTGVTFKGNKQVSSTDPLGAYSRYIFEVSNSGQATLHSRFESDDLDADGTLGSGLDVTAILGTKAYTDNGIASSNGTGSFNWNSLAGLDFIPIKNSVTPGAPINENYYVGSSKYNPLNNVVDRNEPFNVWGDNRFVTREDGSQTIRIYAVDALGAEYILYEYVPSSFSTRPDIYRAYSKDGAEYLRIRGSRCNVGGINCSTEDRLNFTRLYFRKSQTEAWVLVDDMDTQTPTSNPTKIIQDLTQANIYGQFDEQGNIVKNARSKWWLYKAGSGYGIDLTSILFNGASSTPAEYSSSYGVANTPYGLLFIAGRKFNQLFFATAPGLFFVQVESN